MSTLFLFPTISLYGTALSSFCGLHCTNYPATAHIASWTVCLIHIIHFHWTQFLSSQWDQDCQITQSYFYAGHNFENVWVIMQMGNSPLFWMKQEWERGTGIFEVWRQREVCISQVVPPPLHSSFSPTTIYYIHKLVKICKNSLANSFWDDRNWTTVAYLKLRIFKSSLLFPSDLHTVFQLYTFKAEARPLKYIS
jgi:hypothetical protein